MLMNTSPVFGTEKTKFASTEKKLESLIRATLVTRQEEAMRCILKRTDWFWGRYMSYGR